MLNRPGITRTKGVGLCDQRKGPAGRADLSSGVQKTLKWMRTYGLKGSVDTVREAEEGVCKWAVQTQLPPRPDTSTPVNQGCKQGPGPPPRRGAGGLTCRTGRAAGGSPASKSIKQSTLSF